MKKLVSILLTLAVAVSLCLVTALPAAAQDPAVFQTGGDRLVATQNDDGGWDWPLDDGDPTAGSADNTIGPIGIGLAQAYHQTSDPAMYTALEKTGAFLLTKTNNFTCWDGYLAVQLDNIFGGTTYTDFVKTHFYDLLAAGTYEGKSGTYDTEGYINHIGYAWDLGIGLISATSVGIDPSEIDKWVAGVKTAIDGLDNRDDDYYPSDLAGGLYGLAYAEVTEFSGDVGGISMSSVADLAAELASLQASSGAFSLGMELAQDTAYALLALNEFNRSVYIDNILSAGDYLENAQLGTGGWLNGADDPDPAGHTENNEMTGEALWALSAVGSGWVSMSASYIPQIGISVGPASIDFGDVEPTVASDAQMVTVTNTGNVAEDFSASIENESHSPVYADGLTIDSSGVSAWSVSGVATGGDTGELPLILTVPAGTAPGAYTATLVFWAEMA